MLFVASAKDETVRPKDYLDAVADKTGKYEDERGMPYEYRGIARRSPSNIAGY
jgi:hypothetical protein